MNKNTKLSSIFRFPFLGLKQTKLSLIFRLAFYSINTQNSRRFFVFTFVDYITPFSSLSWALGALLLGHAPLTGLWGAVPVGAPLSGVARPQGGFNAN